ncbi:hypothetical protein G7Z17_g12690 [Cylindrodendrum hubeiense]|uniref:Indoleamine 2,3-dioxygenase n=1 Tax=Cylindrodendrum hubeiense TaxID=595255 RepID=A0A9P5GYH8_9HYPO|nr:hypothetical protein G7Z17_g12690 [Cylindrodendrum hubeiense]
MSPHAIRQNSSQINPSTELRKFAVSRNAFLPEDAPLKQLPNAYYEPWELIVHNLPSLIEAGETGIRRAVDQLPVLSTDRLQSEPEWRRAYVILAFVTHAYILPPQISVPFLKVSKHLELPPVLTYAAANLWNFSCAGDDFSNLADLDTLISFTGTQSEAWFLLISVAMEARAGAIIPPMMAALDAVKTREYDVIISALDGLRTCIDGVGVLLERMYEKNDPSIFYNQIRPFLAGSKSMEAAGLPRGVFYDEGEGKGEWMQLRGGSNGQSSLIQFFDIVLGIEHSTTGNNTPEPGLPSYHELIRDYMPGPHKRFLIHMTRMGSIRELANLPAANDDHRRMKEAFKAATEALTIFRTKHIGIVTRYIILPSKQAAMGGRQNLASASSSKKEEKELTGTGGTVLVPFLKQSRDETAEAGKLKN